MRYFKLLVDCLRGLVVWFPLLTHCAAAAAVVQCDRLPLQQGLVHEEWWHCYDRLAVLPAGQFPWKERCNPIGEDTVVGVVWCRVLCGDGSDFTSTSWAFIIILLLLLRLTVAQCAAYSQHYVCFFCSCCCDYLLHNTAYSRCRVCRNEVMMIVTIVIIIIVMIISLSFV